MKASFTPRRITCTVLAAALVALPSNSALAAPAPAAAKPAATTAPATTSAPATTAAPTTTTPTTPPATTAAPADPNAPVADPNAPVDPNAPPAEGEPPTEVAQPEPPAEEPAAEPPPPPAPVVPEGPERPPEPTVGNGKYKAKGTGMMIAGGTLLGVGLAGVISTYFLTRCDEPENSFQCRNKAHNTFAVPATGALTLLGTVLLLVGVGYHVRYKKWERWTPKNAKAALTPTMLRGGGGVSYTLNF